jgi:hypothetical protein
MSAFTVAVLSLSLLATPTSFHGTTHCNIEKEKGDVVSQDHDLVIEPGQSVHNAVAVNGNVLVKKGAHVSKSVLAIQGSVTLEPGAVVDEDVLALGGDVHALGNARIGKDAVALGGILDLSKSAHVEGSHVNLSLNLNGTDVAQKLIDAALGPDHSCQVTESKSSARDDE